VKPSRRKQAREFSADALLLVGVASLIWCAHLVYPPAAFGVGGAGALFLSWALGRSS
jgi:hypothetical protein